jgi:4,5-dihydroxyphthalate decarboxylase
MTSGPAIRSEPAPITLHTLLAAYPTTAALRNGDIRSPLVHLDFADVNVSNTAFKPLVREYKFDLAELAIVTYLQARAYGKPYVLLPAVVMGRGQHHTIAYNAERGNLSPGDLPGRRVGVRAYTQTTGAWLRGILAEDYGVDFRRVRWVTFEEPHLAEYHDPEIVERAPAGKQMLTMLLDAEIDAAIFGNELPDARLKTLIPDAEAAAQRWAERHGGVPINHMMVMRESIVRQRPEVVKEVYRMLLASKNAAPVGTDPHATRFGVEANRRSLEIIIGYAVDQGLIPRRFTVDELFDEAIRALNA